MQAQPALPHALPAWGEHTQTELVLICTWDAWSASCSEYWPNALGWMIFTYNLHTHHRPESHCIFSNSSTSHCLKVRPCSTLHQMYIYVVVLDILDILLTFWRRRECHVSVFVRRVSGWDVLDWTRSKTGGRMCIFNWTICDCQSCIWVLHRTICCIFSSHCAQKWFKCILTITLSLVPPAGFTALTCQG